MKTKHSGNSNCLEAYCNFFLKSLHSICAHFVCHLISNSPPELFIISWGRWCIVFKKKRSTSFFISNMRLKSTTIDATDNQSSASWSEKIKKTKRDKNDAPLCLQEQESNLYNVFQRVGCWNPVSTYSWIKKLQRYNINNS